MLNIYEKSKVVMDTKCIGARALYAADSFIVNGSSSGGYMMEVCA